MPYGIAAATRAIPDSPAARVLEEVAASEQACLVVIGSSDFGPVSRVLIGTVGERLLRGSPCAVAVAPAGFGNRPARSLKRIGVCWDGSREAHEARDLGIELARASGADLRLYTAIQPVSFGQPPYPVSTCRTRSRSGKRPSTGSAKHAERSRTTSRQRSGRDR